MFTQSKNHIAIISYCWFSCN